MKMDINGGPERSAPRRPALRLIALLTLSNLALIAYLLSQVQPTGAQSVAAVVRAGLGLNLGSDTTYALIEAKDADSYRRSTTSAGRRQIIKP
jgi:hypothetical protein